MSKDVSMTIRVEADLRASFSAAVEKEHRPMAQVLRELMREYVERGRRQSALVSEEERTRRQEAVDYAFASVGLEGLAVSDKDRAHAQRFINGEIDLETFVKGRVHG